MFKKITLICWLAAFVLAFLSVILGIGVAIAWDPYEGLQALVLPFFCWISAWSVWLMAFSLDKIAGNREAMRALGNRVADATQKAADRARRAVSNDD